jgi:hypothetical protein
MGFESFPRGSQNPEKEVPEIIPELESVVEGLAAKTLSEELPMPGNLDEHEEQELKELISKITQDQEKS